MRTKERLITVADALGVVKRFFVLILAVAILSGALGYAYAFLSKTEYYSASSVVYFHTATADMIEGPDANDISRARALAASCAEVFPNDSLIANIREYFADRRADRPSENWEDLSAYGDAAIKSMLSAETVASSQKLTVTVKAPTAALACHLANAAAGELQVSIVDTVGPCRVELTSQAKSAKLYSDFSKRPALAAAVIGALGAYLLLFAYAFFDPRLRTERDVTIQCAEGAVIGTVGMRRTPPALLNGRESATVRESYNTARITLLSRIEEAGLSHPVIGVAGVGAAADADCLALNLATSFARLSRRVLVVDADWRASSLGTLLGKTDEKGLFEVAFGEKIAPVLLDGMDVSLLSRGATPENAADFLGSAAFAKALTDLSSDYDITLVRLPSLSETADAMTAAGAIDGFVVGVSLTADTAKKLAVAQTRLETVKARLLGVIAMER